MKMKEGLFTSELKVGEFGREDSKLHAGINAKMLKNPRTNLIEVK